MDPTTIALISALLQGAGGAIGGAQQAGAAGASTEEQARQFDIMRMERERKRREGLPMRDRLNYYFQQRLGMPQQQFRPHDIFNPSYGSGPTQFGGVDQDAWNAIVAGYKPGAGGILGDNAEGNNGSDSSLISSMISSELPGARKQLQKIPDWMGGKRYTEDWWKRKREEQLQDYLGG